MGIDGNLTRKQFLGAATAALIVPQIVWADQDNSQPDGKLTESDLKGGDKLAGIALSDQRHKMAIAGVKTNIKNYEGVRKIRMPNNVEPNLVFTPKGRQPSPGKSVSIRIPPTASPTPTNSEDWAYSSMTELSEAIKRKVLSPVELTKLYLERLDKYGSKLQCVITMTPELALRQAKKAEDEIMKGKYRGRLHGIPYGIKDLFAVKGYRTTWGAETFQDQVIDHDSAVVEKLTAAGAVCLAKLSCGALAYDDVWFGGKTKNPWKPSEGSSGSSAGSACSAAAGLAAFTIGTETLGSIISPSNRCRVSGLRPTYGRVSRFGGMALTWTMDKVGTLCRTIEDCAVVLGAIHGADPRDLSSVDRPYHYNSKIDVSKLKIGVIVDDKEDPISKADWAIELKKLGATLRPVKFSSPPEGIWALLVAEAAAFFDEVTTSDNVDKIGKLWPPEFLAARYLPAVEYINAHRARALMSQKFEEELGDFDVVVTDHFWDEAFTICNGTGHPQAIIPWGLTKSGAPRSVSVIGRLYDEPTVCAVAHKIQQTRSFHRLRPDSSKW